MINGIKIIELKEVVNPIKVQEKVEERIGDQVKDENKEVRKKELNDIHIVGNEGTKVIDEGGEVIPNHSDFFCGFIFMDSQNYETEILKKGIEPGKRFKIKVFKSI